jgi:hypothetical protein
VVVAVATAGFIFFVPMCFGSLEAGTYECITLARRVMAFARAAVREV